MRIIAFRNLKLMDEITGKPIWNGALTQVQMPATGLGTQ